MPAVVRSKSWIRLAGVVKLARDENAEIQAVVDQNGAVTQFFRDERSLVTQIVDARGAERRYEYDAHANLVGFRAANGGEYRFGYDFLGRMTSEARVARAAGSGRTAGPTDPRGDTRRYEYDDAGQIVAIHDALGRSFAYDYDSMGNIVREVLPDGMSITVDFGGLNWPYRLRRPDGSELRVTYNREGWALDAHESPLTRGDVARPASSKRKNRRHVRYLTDTANGGSGVTKTSIRSGLGIAIGFLAAVLMSIYIS